MIYESSSYAAPRHEWIYSVQAPQILSPLWVLERLAGLGVPIAGLCLLGFAHHLGLVSLF